MNIPKNQILNCDVLDGFKQLPDNSIDLCVTSPPYNCGMEYDSWDDNKPWKTYLDWTRQWIGELKRVLKPDGRFAINHLIEMGISENGKKNAVRVSPQVELHNIITQTGMNIVAQPVWVDPTKSKLTAWGSWMNASCPYIYNPYEIVLVGCKSQWKKSTKGENTITKENFLKGVSGVWNIKPETKGYTIANFPIELPKLCIELLSYKNDTILDPFMGSGTTALASIDTDRVYVGFEISKEYHRVSIDRINSHKKSIPPPPVPKKIKPNKKVEKNIFFTFE